MPSILRWAALDCDSDNIHLKLFSFFPLRDLTGKLARGIKGLFCPTASAFIVG
jgi:hypothetical protein